ncbi:MAG: TldD/PmbA family protein [Candidatus Delongbacteria bacterium]|nr:TldD/PmbA family protein [Candidatus Delongbacteria bacterium]MBN2833784.1 TldD/PmbA family protein [Candidatus Delongbacteria bacterium]
MLEFLKNLKLANYQTDFLDLRIEEKVTSFVLIRNGEVMQANKLPEKGAFIRSSIDKMWRYESTTDLNSLTDVLKSMSNGYNEETVSMDFDIKSIDNLSENFIGDLSIPDIKNLLMSFYEKVNDVDFLADINILFKSEKIIKYYADSRGKIRHYSTENGGVVAFYTLKDGNEIFRSSYDRFGKKISVFDDFGDCLVKDINKASLFLKAETITPGKFPVVLSEFVTGIFAHESFGHKSESDFMIGDESMKEEWSIGKKVGSEILTIVDDGSHTNSSGFAPFDDEGNEKIRTYLIKNGILSGRLHSEMTSQYLKEENTGNARALNFKFEPIVRMTTTYLEKGDLTFEEMIKPIKFGYYIEKPSHGSGMSTFTIAVNRAWKIEDGKLTDPVKINVITGNIFETLHKIDGVGNEVKLFSFVGGGCGKMEQYPLSVGLGGPKVRVSEMMVS